MQKVKKILSTFLAFILILAPILTVYASGFRENDSRYNNLYDGLETSVTATRDQFPFNLKNKEISQVGFDILYGTNRGLVYYLGEVPYPNTRTDDGTPLEGFAKLPTWEFSPDIDTSEGKSYWGDFKLDVDSNSDVKAMSGSRAIPRKALEEVNTGNEIKSLRLLALSETTGGAWVNLGTFIYGMFSALTRGAIWVNQLVGEIKVIELGDILDALNLDNFMKMISNLFIFTENASGERTASILLIISLVVLILTIVKFSLNALKGTGASGFRNFFGEIGIPLMVGFMLIGVASLGGITSLGESYSNVVNAVLTVGNATTETEAIFKTAVSGDDVKMSRLNFANQMSAINKIYIDAQITTQFDVSRIEELALTEFTNNPAIINKLGNENQRAQFGNNLGYYFWFANNGAIALRNNTLPTDGLNQHTKMANVFTFLQESYTEALNKGDLGQQSKILRMLRGFAHPEVGPGTFKMILLIVLFVMLAIATFGYALMTVVGKVYLFAGILTIPVAGLLILSANKKAISTGKNLLGISLVGAMYILVFSVFFDMIIYTIGAVLKNEWFRIVLAIVLLFVFRMFKPAIENFLKSLLTAVERLAAPQFQRQLAGVKRGISSFSANVETRAKNVPTKVIGYDDNGNEILGHSRLNRWTRAIAAGINGAANGRDGKGFTKNLSDKNREIKETNKKLRESTTTKFRDEKNNEYNSMVFAYTSAYNRELSKYTWEENGETNFNLENLSQEDRNLYNSAVAANDTAAALRTGETYKGLAEKEADGTITIEERKQLNNLQEKITSKEAEAKKLQNELKEKIKSKAREDVFEEYGDELKHKAENIQKSHEAVLNDKIRNGEQISRDDLISLVKRQKMQDELEKGNVLLEKEVELDTKELKLIDDALAEKRNLGNSDKITKADQKIQRDKDKDIATHEKTSVDLVKNKMAEKLANEKKIKEEVKTPEVKKEEVKTETVKTEAAKTEVKKEEAKVETPKDDSKGKVETTKKPVEEPKKEVTTKPEPKVEQPKEPEAEIEQSKGKGKGKGKNKTPRLKNQSKNKGKNQAVEQPKVEQPKPKVEQPKVEIEKPEVKSEVTVEKRAMRLSREHKKGSVE